MKLYYLCNKCSKQSNYDGNDKCSYCKSTDVSIIEDEKLYNKEDLQTDIDWLIDCGVDNSEAETFILDLLNKQPCGELKK